LTNPGLAVGTPEYMAPEQALGQEVDARADIYAVGTLMFEMLCGRVPFVGSSVAELLALKTGCEPPQPRLFAPTISAPLQAFILRCLARDRGDRPQSMEEVELRLFELSRDSGALSQPRLAGPMGGLLPSSPHLVLPPASAASAPSASSLAERLGTLAPPAAAGVTGSPLGSATSHGPSAPSHDALPLGGTEPGRRPTARRLTATALLLAVATVAIGFVSARYLTRPSPPPAEGPTAALSGSLARGPAASAKLTTARPAPSSQPSAGLAPATAPAGQPLAPATSPTPAPDARVVEVLEGRVPMLFEWARRTVAGGRFVSPPGDNLLELLTRIEDVAPNHPELPRLRGEAAATVLRRAREHLRRRQPQEAFELYRTLLAIESGAGSLTGVRAGSKPSGLARRFPRSELQLQLLYVARTGRSGGHGASLAAGHAAIELAPRSAAAHLALADALLAANRREAAAGEYRRVLELHPRSLERRLAEHGLVRLGLRPTHPPRGREIVGWAQPVRADYLPARRSFLRPPSAGLAPSQIRNMASAKSLPSTVTEPPPWTATVVPLPGT
jgi:tetratricopeptide (TPR) repeat protein